MLDPLEVVIENYPEGESEELEAVNNPENEAAGKRSVPHGRRLFIERAILGGSPEIFRLWTAASAAALRYFITCQVSKDAEGNVTRSFALRSRNSRQPA